MPEFDCVGKDSATRTFRYQVENDTWTIAVQSSSTEYFAVSYLRSDAQKVFGLIADAKCL